jgi:hypothetical protein
LPPVRISDRPGVVLGFALALAFASHAVVARAEIQERAVPVVQHYVDATGGAGALAAQRMVHLKGHLDADGMRGSWEEWRAAPNRWMRRVTLGSLRYREGFDGTVAWRTDLSDRSVIVRGTGETVRAEEEGWFLNERWALPDQGGGSIEIGSTSYWNDGIYDLIRVTPPVGRPRRLFVNQKTGFVERVVGERDQYTIEEHPSGYRMLGGRKRPSVLASPTLLPSDKPVERTVVDSAWTNVAFDTARFSPPTLEARAIAWPRARHVVRVPFKYGSKAVMVKVSINGLPPEDFLLDTGASLTVLDASYAYSLGLPVEGAASIGGIAASGEIRYARVSSIALDQPDSTGVALRDFRVALLDLAEDSQIILWRKPMGILGADFLSRFVVEIDYDSLTVTLRDPATFRYAGRGTAIPFETDHGCPLVDMTVDDGCSGKFLVDVGNSFHFVVHGSMVRACHMIGEKKRHEVEVVGGGVGGGFYSTLCRLDSLRIGPYVWTEPVAALSLHTSGGIGSKEVAGNIGNDVLERFQCTFDYAHHVLYLAPGHRFAERDRVSRFGALFARFGPHVIAGNILTGSAAYEAGLRWYDEIVAVDGKPLEQWSREDVDRLLEEGPVGSEHTVTYRRLDYPEATVTVTLKDVL